MASITETGVRVRIILRQIDGAPRVIVQAESIDATGERVRSMGLDITDQLSAARLTGIADLIADVTARAKAFWEIP